MASRSYVALVLLVLAVIVALACTPTTSAELMGEYIAQYPFGTERIILRDDGTYRQEIIVQGDPEKVTQTGRWEYIGASRSPFDVGKVYLYGCRALADGFGRLNSEYKSPSGISSICSLTVEREHIISGRLRFGSDSGYPHTKH